MSGVVQLVSSPVAPLTDPAASTAVALCSPSKCCRVSWSKSLWKFGAAHVMLVEVEWKEVQEVST